MELLYYPSRDSYVDIFAVCLYLTDGRDEPGLAVIVLIGRQKQVQNDTNKMELLLITSVMTFVIPSSHDCSMFSW
jgi:hypothetical protein